MRKITYLAVMEPTKDGYSVYYPDLPGCISFGATIDDAQKQAAEALELHVYGMEKDHEELPAPSVDLNPDDIEGCVVSPISVFPDIVKNEMDNRRVKTNVTIPAWLKEAAEHSKVNYSKLLEASLIEYLGIKSQTK